MAREIVEHRDYYVYVLYREDGTTPFYVGKGRGRRWQQHEVRAKKGKSYKDNIICAILSKYGVLHKEKVAVGLTNAQANDVEIELIAKLGRKPIGPLVNITEGGEGTPGRVNSPEHRAAISAYRKSQKGKKVCKEPSRLSQEELHRVRLAGAKRLAEYPAEARVNRLREFNKSAGFSFHSNRSRNAMATLGTSGLSERAKKSVAAQTSAQRSEARRRSWITRRNKDPQLRLNI